MPKLAIEDLAPWSRNPRRIDDAARDGLRASVERWGDIAGITYNSRTGTLVSGHQRVEVLRALGAQMVDGALQLASGHRFPVRVVDWDESEHAGANIEANNKHIGGEYTENLDELLAEVRGSLGDESFETLRLDALLSELDTAPAEVEQDEVPEPPAEPVTKLGDVWTLGEHTLVCGDSCGVECPSYSLMVTDPPYGVSYAAKNEFLNAISPGNRIQEPIENDHMNKEDMDKFWRAAFGNVRASADPGASYYVTGPQGGDLLLLIHALDDCGFRLRHMLIWAKNNHVLGRSDYHYKHEPIIYGWVEGAHSFYGGSSQTSLWEIARPHKSKLHPTMKPVELFARAIENSSAPGQAVIDPFAGSGTTLIAAEQLGRRCHAIEIEPRYCDVIIERWQQLTGGEAKRV